ncbi:B-cell antigen receptor complex-associated protein beta chain [Cheilinus undulatus]|uniref:B-cell antigen receptor complex-associated protein beta chain n=1 Tax=Cheilinus undulatus TaxID=241271 RepID=UPI001BD384A9|nr:B-cell antigen receptor complex-associated protein beta chain [Cheilinus undulatus]
MNAIMLWLLLVGCCGLSSIKCSVAKETTERIIQKPRYYGVKTGAYVEIHCLPPESQKSETWQWYWAAEHNGTKNLLPGQRKNVQDKGRSLRIMKVKPEDSGVYFCKTANKWGPGTGLKVVKNINVTEALYRTNMKDGLMIFQGLLLAVCIAALIRCNRELFERGDSVYEEPETDHIYEGLEIETCGGDLYEELPVYEDTDGAGAEAPWE